MVEHQNRFSSDMGTPDYGDPHPNITSDMRMWVTISLTDMRLLHLPITLAVWGSSMIWGSLTTAASPVPSAAGESCTQRDNSLGTRQTVNIIDQMMLSLYYYRLILLNGYTVHKITAIH